MKLSAKTSIISVGTVGLLALALTGCSQSNTGTTSPASSAPVASSAAPSVAPTPAATIASLSGVHTQVTLDSGFLAALKSLKLTPGVTGKASLDAKTGVLTFPITGGNVTYYDPAQFRHIPGGYVQGEVDHNGSGITLTAGDTKVGLSDFVVHPGSGSTLTGTVSLNGKVYAKNVTIFTLDGSTLKPLYKDSDGNAVLEGTTVYVSPDAAALLNKVFKTDAVKGGTSGLEVGIAKITAK